MLLKDRIQKNLTGAIKNKEELEASVLRLLTAAILNKEKEKRYTLKEEKDTPLTDEETIAVIASEIKKRKEAVAAYRKGRRQDLADKEAAEAEVLQKYLPEQLAEEEIRRLVKEAILKTGAKEAKDIGRVMSTLMPRVRGRAEAGTVSSIVKESLA